jgi:hypothetical protein
MFKMKENAVEISGYLIGFLLIFELRIQVSEYHLYSVAVIALKSVIFHPLLFNTILLFTCKISLLIVIVHIKLHVFQLQYFAH